MAPWKRQARVTVSRIKELGTYAYGLWFNRGWKERQLQRLHRSSARSYLCICEAEEDGDGLLLYAADRCFGAERSSLPLPFSLLLVGFRLYLFLKIILSVAKIIRIIFLK